MFNETALIVLRAGLRIVFAISCFHFHQVTDVTMPVTAIGYSPLLLPTIDYCWRSWTSRIAATYKSRVD